MSGLRRGTKGLRGPRGPRGGEVARLRPQNTIDVASTPISKTSVDSAPCFEDNFSHDSPSPIPFVYSQDTPGSELDVVWNFYSPKSGKRFHALGTPIRKRKQVLHDIDISPISSIPPRRKIIRHNQMKEDFLKSLKEELTAINLQVQKLIHTEPKTEICSDNSNSKDKISREEPDIFDDTLNDTIVDDVLTSSESNKTVSNIVPRKTLISERISKFENEAIESDDSMNEYLLRASQLVESKFKQKQNTKNDLKCNGNFVKLPEPVFNNDSFDNLISNMNDSYVDIISQSHAKVNNKVNETNSKYVIPDDTINQLIRNDMCEKGLVENHVNYTTYTNISWNNISDFPTLLSANTPADKKVKFGRHKSMPVSSPNENKNANISFIRHNSMPKEEKKNTQEILTPMCSQEEIMRKRQAAKEKLLAKKYLSTDMCQMNPIGTYFNKKSVNDTNNVMTKSLFTSQLKENTCNRKINSFEKKDSGNINSLPINKILSERPKNLSLNSNIHDKIEKKRREALQKLQKKKTSL